MSYTRTLIATVAFGLLAGQATAQNVSSSIQCPASTTVGSTPTIGVTLKNNESSAFGVQILSSYTANQNDTLGGAAILGPVVAGTTTVGGFSTNTLSIHALPAVPPSLANKLATYVITADWGDDKKVQVQDCVVFIPEPDQILQVLAGVIGLFIASRRRSGARTLEGTVS
ncbi:MAG TPA: hypothetical protein VMS55_11180 [Myxococcota bacterium]|nr:hypothetical protein [Myxococcota bacterium]